MDRMYRKTLGKWGEEKALLFLESQGYSVIMQNFTCHHGQIDLICQKEGVVSFIEVKTRTNTAFGYGESSVKGTKLAALRRAINAYFERFNLLELPGWQIDVLVVEGSPNGAEPNYFLFENVGCHEEE